jgi:hypothetical protein
MSNLDFIMAVEDGTITPEQFRANVQSFYNSGVWRHLQGAWHRQIAAWIEFGHIEGRMPEDNR